MLQIQNMPLPVEGFPAQLEKRAAKLLGIRPEQITISREKTDAAQVEARVYAGMPAGSETLVSVRVGEKLITVKELGSTHYAGDETVYLSYPPKKVNVFDASTKRLIKYSR